MHAVIKIFMKTAHIRYVYEFLHVDLGYGYACWLSIQCMVSTTAGRAPKAPSPLLWRRPKAAIMLLNGEPANIAILQIHT